jgi:hypothetical protein
VTSEEGKKSEHEMTDTELDRWDEPGFTGVISVNAGHSREAMEEASGRMLLRKDRV